MYTILPGSAARIGASASADGVNFAVFSANAAQVELCLFSDDGKKERQRLKLPERSGGIWHGFVPKLPVGTLYGYRVHGDYQPEQGHRFNPNKLLLDPYTRELKGQWSTHSATLGYDSKASDEDLSFDTRDSAAYVPKSVVSDPEQFQYIHAPVHDAYDFELIYEAHVKGLTQLHPSVAQSVRGTYEGLASEAIIEHLHSLNVSTIELLPVHAFIDDGFLQKRGLRNYWGYNTIGFFAPEPRYFGSLGVLGFKQMVQTFQNAGIDVILDVVYNHTAEGDQRGATLSYRGLDNASYYRLQADNPRYYVNDTGCGNTVNVAHPMVMRMVTDSLRFWVECMGVSGFRFDLATTLAREDTGYNPRGAFLSAVRQDPILSNVRLIAEPWDIGLGGYQLGGFPHPFSEWNDAYRDSVRQFWRGEPHAAQELGARLLASADRFASDKRPAWASVNFLSSHDGFTLADLTRYNEKHNEANTEDNQDGHDANYSDNCGVEGDTDDAGIAAKRSQRQRNMLATLLLSQGAPMLLGGDEISNSQHGNNNAYCQDNEIGWIDWAQQDTGLLEFAEGLSQFRKDHPILYQSRHLHGTPQSEGGAPDVEWLDFSAQALDWGNPSLSQFCLLYRWSAYSSFAKDRTDEAMLIVFNREVGPATLTLPVTTQGLRWQTRLDTSNAPYIIESPQRQATLTVAAESVLALELI